MVKDSGLITLALVILLAAAVNGRLGYGFSTITAPVADVLHDRVVNPALVLVEVALNAYLLFINRKSISSRSDAVRQYWERR